MESASLIWKHARAHIYNEENLNWGNISRDAKNRINYFFYSPNTVKTKSVSLLCKELGDTEGSRTQHLVPALQEFMISMESTNIICICDTLD